MSKVLVVYGTKSGSVTDVAGRIGEVIAKRGAEVEVASAESAPDPSAYDAVVVGSGIRMSQFHAPVRAWVAQHAETLKARPTAFFSVGMMINEGPEKAEEVRAYTKPLSDETGVEPVDIGMFAGWNLPKEFSMVERLVMKAMKAPEGDFRDWDAIDAWAEAVAPKLGLAG